MIEKLFSDIIKHTVNEMNESSRKYSDISKSIEKHKESMGERRKNMRII